MSKRNSFHVVPRGDQWAVIRPGAERSSRNLDTQREAIDYAADRARREQPSQVIIHRPNGQIRDERTYGSDPCPPKG